MADAPKIEAAKADESKAEEPKPEEAEAKIEDALAQEPSAEGSVPKAEEAQPEEVRVPSEAHELHHEEEAEDESDETVIAEIQEKVNEAIEENTRLRSENEALRLELDKLLAMTMTPEDTPPSTAGR
eukprot:TRINITY_DN14288_c0_g2_i1.p1 TRINITY_DN14288_c0_g2~~TRINITY_DN14288_c0_g2_i1.p1  ORF type:complete len:140 (-),score=46.16 TRINITY_DN14288_c0_g2_i1:399-779(-)